MLTVVLGVPEGPDVEKGRTDPVQGHADVADGQQDDLRVQVLHQVAVEAGEAGVPWWFMAGLTVCMCVYVCVFECVSVVPAFNNFHPVHKLHVFVFGLSLGHDYCSCRRVKLTGRNTFNTL